jgi:hypothetical protein
VRLQLSNACHFAWAGSRCQLDAITGAADQLARLRDSPAVPDQPDRQWVDDWLHRSYLNFWTRTR